MSLLIKVLGLTRTTLQSTLIKRDIPVRLISSSHTCYQEESNTIENSNEIENTDEIIVDPAKDRRQVIPVETSIEYMLSSAYKQTYGDDPVWTKYRRNHKGQFPSRKTRKTCVRGGIISTGNPCPICRDEYLILDHRNVKLLEQFISKHTGEILSYRKTGICQRRYKQLLVAVLRAKEYGTLLLDVPLREYDYSEWYNEKTQQH
ncbi:PREDICTED: 28S ribosomal protein S18b, mitochondrial [Polistes dominula]|uniref:Small ribosomal subunit protein mS40 n=1 Tax=Polistes dominula TaxID=743375 RepID=A0ABM1IVM8_POLDO|nr:PREDICTED: 28S ribosomal protein S18b, mitochondrial [Polistes dominula]